MTLDSFLIKLKPVDRLMNARIGEQSAAVSFQLQLNTNVNLNEGGQSRTCLCYELQTVVYLIALSRGQ